MLVIEATGHYECPTNGTRFQCKASERGSQYKDMVVRPAYVCNGRSSYFSNGNPFTSKMAILYRDESHDTHAASNLNYGGDY